MPQQSVDLVDLSRRFLRPERPRLETAKRVLRGRRPPGSEALEAFVAEGVAPEAWLDGRHRFVASPFTGDPRPLEILSAPPSAYAAMTLAASSPGLAVAESLAREALRRIGPWASHRPELVAFAGVRRTHACVPTWDGSERPLALAASVVRQAMWAEANRQSVPPSQLLRLVAPQGKTWPLWRSDRAINEADVRLWIMQGVVAESLHRWAMLANEGARVVPMYEEVEGDETGARSISRWRTPVEFHGRLFSEVPDPFAPFVSILGMGFAWSLRQVVEGTSPPATALVITVFAGDSGG